MGEQGILEMILRNNCWKEDRLRLREFLNRVEASRLKARKSRSKKVDEDAPPNLPQWSGEWREAREQLVTDDLRWVERARTGGLPVEMETGRWEHIPRDKRRCACGAKKGSAMHALEHCPLFDVERRKLKIRLRELGLLDENVWHFITKAGGAMKQWLEPVEKKRAVLTEVNAYIARIMQKKKTTSSHSQAGLYNQRAIGEGEEGRELMKKVLPVMEKKKRKLQQKRAGEDMPTPSSKPREERVIHQEINIEELRSLVHEPSGWSSRDLSTVDRILKESVDGVLSVVYARDYEGRWYARGSAQLQSCKKQIRERALKGKGFSLDICASYPAIMSGLISEVVRKRGAVCNMDETRRLIQDTKAWRAEAGKQLGVSVPTVKKGVNAIMFGMNSSNWRRREKIPNTCRSSRFERLEGEIKAARTLITDDEIKNMRADLKDKPSRTLSRAVERAEIWITSALSARLQEYGWITTTLIHDEIIICNSSRFLNLNDEMQTLDQVSKLSLRTFEDSRGWPPGTLQLKIQRI